MKEVEVYTDGACLGNPGPGGWGVVLKYQDFTKELSGYEPQQTTNSRMELLAVIKALEALKEPCIVNIHSDSAYIVNSIKNGWINNWLQNGWKGSTGAICNVDLWKRYLDIAKNHEITMIKVKGHSGVPLNERCDTLARLAIKRSK